ncbi:MAG: phage baseplate protein [Ginsengibacter sp.]
MNALDFSIKAGWPGSADTWEFLQNMIKQAQGSALLGGNNCILSGGVVTGGNATAGIVVVNGEILPFTGGVVQDYVIVVDTATNKQFFGGASNPYYHDRVATFGVGAGQVAWDSFKRNDPDNSVLARLDKVEKMLAPLVGYDDPANPGTTVYGSWMFWGRPAAEIPAGWEAVPDAEWKGRVPVVLDAAQAEFNTVGKTGGEKTHVLTINEMPAHNHGLGANGVVKVNPGSGSTGTVSGGNPSDGGAQALMSTDNKGGGQPHNNLQPYKVVMFIRFAG